MSVRRQAAPNRFQRAMRGTGGTRIGSRIYIRVLHRVDQPIFRLTRGRHTLTSLLTGLPIGVLTSTGARSGLPRHSPLLFYPTSAGTVVIASNYGQAHYPAWYHNLRADPQATVVMGGTEHRVTATQLEGSDRDRIWRECLATFPGLTAYAQWAGDRAISIFRLDGLS